MKTLINYLILIFTAVSLNSCFPVSAMVQSDDDIVVVANAGNITYYDYYMDDYYLNDIPVIFIGGIYYYQYWDYNRHLWWRYPVERYLWHNIIPCHGHRHDLGGYWCGSYPRGTEYRHGVFHHGPNMPLNPRDRQFNGRPNNPNTHFDFNHNNRGIFENHSIMQNNRHSQPNTSTKPNTNTQPSHSGTSTPNNSRSFNGGSHSFTPMGGGFSRGPVFNGGSHGGSSHSGGSSQGSHGGRR